MLQYAKTEVRRWLSAADSAALRVYRPNLLIEGPLLGRGQLLAQLHPHIPTAVARHTAGGALALTIATTRILVHDVDTLSAIDQANLRAWMTSGVDVRRQVVSTSEHSLYALVKSKRFCDDLYYRLNVMLVHVG
jgi:hypothetical protein